MGDLADLVGDITTSIPSMSPLVAENYVKRAYRMIQDMREWSFNIIVNAQLFAPQIITAGAISATFNSTTITTDATARAALNAVALGQPILASPVLGIGRQIRVGNSTPNGPIYSIVAYDTGTGNITIDRPFGEDTVVASPYQCYRIYYANPLVGGSQADTFIRYISITNVASGYSIFGGNLTVMQESLNAIDAQRGATGDAYIASPLQVNSLGQMVHEFYPGPVTYTTYLANFIKRSGLDDTTDLPPVPYALYDLLSFKSKSLSAQWALGNVSTYPELAATNWVAYAKMMENDFKDTRIQCIKQDDSMMPKLNVLRSPRFSIPLGGQFLQSHDLSIFFGQS